MKTPSALLAATLLPVSLPGFVACMPTRTQESAGQYIDDATLTTRVKVALADDPQVKAMQVNVETFRGVVQLSGFVDSEAAKRRAVELARAIPGVRSVKDDMHVKAAR